MSSSNGNGWKPRKIETLTCPSGQVVRVKRPGPEFTLRAGRVARTFSQDKEALEKVANLSPEEVIAQMSDDELSATVIFARELVVAMLVSPRLVLNPKPDSDEIGPDDIGNDFWFLFNYAMTGFFGLKIPVGKDQEVQVSDLETFPDNTGVQRDSVDSVHVPLAEAESSPSDSGLQLSTGA